MKDKEMNLCSVKKTFQFYLEGTVIVISSNPAFTDRNAL